MDATISSSAREDVRLGNIANRSEKGTAFSLIRAETKATNEKTARLRALRLEREASGEPAPEATDLLAARKPKTARATATKRRASTKRAAASA